MVDLDQYTHSFSPMKVMVLNSQKAFVHSLAEYLAEPSLTDTASKDIFALHGPVVCKFYIMQSVLTFIHRFQTGLSFILIAP